MFFSILNSQRSEATIVSFKNFFLSCLCFRARVEVNLPLCNLKTFFMFVFSSCNGMKPTRNCVTNILSFFFLESQWSEAAITLLQDLFIVSVF